MICILSYCISFPPPRDVPVPPVFLSTSSHHLAFCAKQCTKTTRIEHITQCIQKKGLTQLLHSKARTQQYFLAVSSFTQQSCSFTTKLLAKHISNTRQMLLGISGHQFYTITMMPQWHAMISNFPIKYKNVYISQLERLAAELGPGAFLPCVSNSLSSTMACGTLMGRSQGARDATFPCYE